MSIKVLFPVMLGAGLVLVTVVWSGHQPARPLPAATPLAAVLPATSKPVVEFPALKTTAPASMVAEAEAAADQTEPAVDKRIAELGVLAMNSDLDSLNLILVSLNDPDPRIRAAALDATIQFHSPKAIPSLQDALALAELPREKVNLQEAIDFLKLPPLALAETKDP